jgi:hypothetical protein
LPGSGVLSEALVEQFAIEVGECHGIAGKRGRTNSSRRERFGCGGITQY